MINSDQNSTSSGELRQQQQQTHKNRPKEGSKISNPNGTRGKLKTKLPR